MTSKVASKAGPRPVLAMAKMQLREPCATTPELRGAVMRARTMLEAAAALVQRLERAERVEAAPALGLARGARRSLPRARARKAAVDETNRRWAAWRGQDSDVMFRLAAMSAVAEAAGALKASQLDGQCETSLALLDLHFDRLLDHWPELAPAPGDLRGRAVFRESGRAWLKNPRRGHGTTKWAGVVALLVVLGQLPLPSNARLEEAARGKAKKEWERWAAKAPPHLR